jgi:hypothetical protein
MNRILLAGVLAVALGGGAMAQTSTDSSTSTSGTSSSASTSNSTSGNKVGLAKPPAGTSPPSTKKPRGSTNLLNNTPLTPQIAIQPGPTVGSPVPISGPGGTSPNPTGY